MGRQDIWEATLGSPGTGICQDLGSHLRMREIWSGGKRRTLWCSQLVIVLWHSNRMTPELCLLRGPRGNDSQLQGTCLDPKLHLPVNGTGDPGDMAAPGLRQGKSRGSLESKDALEE